MEIKELLSGIAVVIDDQLDSENDIINQVVNWFEENWKIQFVKKKYLPVDNTTSSNLLSVASFVLLDWKFEGYLEEEVIEDIKEFLQCAGEHLVPVIILTYNHPEDIRNKLEEFDLKLINSNHPLSGFVIVESKLDFWNSDSQEVKLDGITNWVSKNPSIYALKTWNNVLDRAKNEMFKVMCGRNVNWPTVFWENYTSDGVDPSISLTELISSNMLGRMQNNAFNGKYLQPHPDENNSGPELKSLITESSFIESKDLSDTEIRCGDLYECYSGKFLLNLRPDCDCIPRNGQSIEEIDVYCIEGEELERRKLIKSFNNKYGTFNEGISRAIVFGVNDGKSIEFQFKHFRNVSFSELKEKRIGRLIHPYITRIQQRFSLYIQRQGLPKIPNSALDE